MRNLTVNVNSLVIFRENGSVLLACGFEFTKRYNFRPFSDAKIDKYRTKHTTINGDVLEKVKQLRVGFPRLFKQYSSPGKVDDWFQDC